LGSGFGQTSTGLRAVESDALIESSFRRLLASIEAERDQIRAAWQRLSQVRDGTTEELERIRQETEDWCYSEKQKIEAEWQRLDKLSVDMASVWPSTLEVLQINCSGEIFTIPKESLTGIPGSRLAEMFSDEIMPEIPRDEQGRFYLDFNPVCFGIVIEYLRNRRLRADAPVPIIPAVQQRNMEVLAEAWKLWPFIKENRINPLHGTSLSVTTRHDSTDRGAGAPAKEIVRATHTGWQVVSAQTSLPVSSPSYFEVQILKNPDSRGGMAIGICNHIPKGMEIHSIHLHCCQLYNSNNGLIGDCISEHDVRPGLQLKEGETLGIRNDVATRTLQWFHNRRYIGSSAFKPEMLEDMRQIYPVCALYVPEQALSVDFRAESPPFPGHAGS